MNMSKRAVGTQHNGERVRKLVTTEEIHMII